MGFSVERALVVLPVHAGPVPGVRALSLAALLLGLPVAAPAAEPPAERRAELRHMVVQDCGSCHGLRLTGGLGPPLTPEALRDKPDALLVNTIQLGRAGTAMPPWSAFLSDDEAAWIVEQLREGLK